MIDLVAMDGGHSVHPEPAKPVAHYLMEEMRARQWSASELLDRMPGVREENIIWLEMIMAEPHMDLEVQLDIKLGDPTALAEAFGTTKEYWTQIDDAYQTWLRTQKA